MSEITQEQREDAVARIRRGLHEPELWTSRAQEDDVRIVIRAYDEQKRLAEERGREIERLAHEVDLLGLKSLPQLFMSEVEKREEKLRAAEAKAAEQQKEIERHVAACLRLEADCEREERRAKKAEAYVEELRRNCISGFAKTAKEQQLRAEAAEKLAEERGREIARLKAEHGHDVKSKTQQLETEAHRVLDLRAKVAELERACSMPVSDIATTLECYRNVYEKDQEHISKLEAELAAEQSAHEQTRRDLSMVEGGMARTAIKRVVSEAREAKLREALEKIAYSCGSYSDARDVARVALAPAAPEPEKTLCSICRQVHGMEIIYECE